MSQPNAFIAVYKGDSVSSARLVAANADGPLVRLVVQYLLGQVTLIEDSVDQALETGRHSALETILAGVDDGNDDKHQI